MNAILHTVKYKQDTEIPSYQYQTSVSLYQTWFLGEVIDVEVL